MPCRTTRSCTTQSQFAASDDATTDKKANKAKTTSKPPLKDSSTSTISTQVHSTPDKRKSIRSRTKSKKAGQAKAPVKEPPKGFAASAKVNAGIVAAKKTDPADAETVPEKPTQGPTMKSVGCQQSDNQWESITLFKDGLTEPVTRTLSTKIWGDLERAIVGSGTMSVLWSTMGDKILYTAQLKEDDGIRIKFQALFSEPKNAQAYAD